VCGHAATHAATRARALLGASGAVLTRWQLIGARVAAASAEFRVQSLFEPRLKRAAIERGDVAEVWRVACVRAPAGADSRGDVRLGQLAPVAPKVHTYTVSVRSWYGCMRRTDT